MAGYRLLTVLPTCSGWPTVTAIVAAVTMTLGNFAAFSQTDVRRLLGYSTISQVGYVLMAVVVAGTTGQALSALLLYLAGYAVTNTGAFAVVAAPPRHSGGLPGGRPASPWIIASLACACSGSSALRPRLCSPAS